jgi:DNA-binding LacI/PurR family transcriptional regulator
MIGIIVPEVTSNFFATLFSYVESFLKTTGYAPLFYISNFESEQEKAGLDVFCQRGVDGIIMTHCTSVDIRARLKRVWDVYRIPVVLLWGGENTPENDYVITDDVPAMSSAIALCLRKGQTKIGFMGDEVSYFIRFPYFQKAMAQNNLDVDWRFIRTSGIRDEEGGYRCMQELLCQAERPEVMFAGYDLMAIGAIRALDEAGLKVPEDCAVIGNDNISSAAYLHKSLSTIAPPLRDIARIAVNLIVTRLGDPVNHAIQTIKVNAEFIARETT